MVGFNADNFDILEFYPYPSSVQYRIAECNCLFDNFKGDIKVKNIFDNILAKANKMTGRDLMDNKISFKVRHIPTDTILYIGFKDNIYAIGLKVWQEFNEKYVFDKK